MGALIAAETAEKSERPVAVLIQRVKEERERVGSLPTLALTTVSTRSVVGSCWVEVDDDPVVASAKQRRTQVESLYDEIRSLTFHEFEVFGGRILHELGASMVHVTPHSSDQGIDFYGVLNLGEFGGLPSPFLQLAHDIQIRFAGQAKHYPTNTLGPSTLS